MVEQHQVLRSGLFGKLHAFEPRGVAPALARGGELLRRKLRVVDEDVGAGGQLEQALVQLRHTRLVVRGIDNRARRRFQAESQAALRMVQPARGHLCGANLVLVAVAHLGKFARRRHRGNVHREIRMGHLRFEDLFQAVRPEEPRAKTVKVEAVALRIERRKKRNPLDVVPVVVGDEDMRLGGLRSVRSHPAVPEHAQPGAAVQDKLRPVGRLHLQARRVSPIAPGRRVHRRRRTAHTPKAESCCRRGHCLALEEIFGCASVTLLGRQSPPGKFLCMVGRGSREVNRRRAATFPSPNHAPIWGCAVRPAWVECPR